MRKADLARRLACGGKATTVSFSGNTPAGDGPRAHFPIGALDYELPEELIAQVPAPERSASRLLVADRAAGGLHDRRITDLPNLLRAGDALVLNDTRVVPAKFELQRATGGRIEGLFLHALASGAWRVLLRGGQRLAEGEVLHFADAGADWRVIAERRGERGHWDLRVSGSAPAADVLRVVGRMPLPPYIKRQRSHDERDPADVARYQTVYAERDGAVAAPTAGLHFTPELLAQVASAGIEILRVTLHVGYGTFAPLEAEDLAEHEMHSEHAELRAEVGRRLRAIRESGGRVVAVGTTTLRALESAAAAGPLRAQAAETRLFIVPGYAFRVVDRLVTNFHLPRSTLLMLVSAFSGTELIRRAYAHAVARKYRFFSYGDAMLLDRVE